MIVDLGCMTDGEPPWDELDDGIRETVRWLWAEGFQSTDSGDGQRQGAKADMEHVLDVPHVFMVCAPEDTIAEADRLRELLCGHGLLVDGVDVQAVYFPLGGVCVLEVYGVSDEMLRANTTREAP